MCGIAGILRLGETPIKRDQIVSLLVSLEERGGDATGIAMMTDGKLTFHKQDEIAWKYVASKGFDKYLEANLTDNTQSVILHTRAWTKGTPSINGNNHPMTVGQSAVVHNGGIHNDDFLFKELKLKREAETDSDIIRAIVDKEGLCKKTIRTLNRMNGSCAAAILHRDHPKKVMLLRSGSPLVLAHTGDQIMWASTKKALHLAARQWEKRHGIWFMANKAELKFNPMAEESAWILDVDEMLARANDPEWDGPWHDRFQSCMNYTAPVYRTHEKYASRQEAKAKEDSKAKEEDPSDKTERLMPNLQQVINSPALRANPHTGLPTQEAPNVGGKAEEALDLKVKCTNPACGIYLNVPKGMQTIDYNKLQCSLCKTQLQVN